MGLFDSYATPVDQIQTGFDLNPSAVPYAVVLTDVKKHTREDGRVSTVLTFTVDSTVDKQGRKGKQDVWITKPVDGQKNADVNARNALTWVKNLGIPSHVYTADNFEIWDHKDKLVGNVRGHLLITQNGDFLNKRFNRAVAEAGNTGPSEVVAPPAKQEEDLDMDKILAKSDGKW